MPNNKWKLTLICLLLASWFTLASTLTAQSTEPETILISNLDRDAFPDVTLTLRVFDSARILMGTVSPDQLSVYENNTLVENVTIGEGRAIPNHVYFMLDRGQYSNYDLYSVSTLRTYFGQYINDGYFREGIDTVALLATDPNQPNDIAVVVPPTQFADDFLGGLSSVGYDKTSKATSLSGIDYAFRQLTRVIEPGEGNIAIVYLGGLFDGSTQSANASSARALSQEFLAVGATFYAIDTRGQDAGPIRELVDGTGGRYVLVDSDNDFSSEIDAIYDDIKSQARTLTVSYRSQLPDSGTRNVAVVPRGLSADMAISTKAYQVNLDVPTVVIESPASGVTLTRNGDPTDDSGVSWVYDKDNEPVRVRVDWTDGTPRQLRILEFIVDGQPVPNSQVRDPESLSYTYTLDLTDIEESRNVKIQVRARDEFGLTGFSEERVLNINVNKQWGVLTPQTPCEADPDGADCLQIQATQTATAIEIETQNAVINEQDEALDDKTTQNQLLSTGLIAAIGVAVAALIMAYTFRRQLRNAPQAIREFTQVVRATILGRSGRGNNVIAKMKVLKGRRDIMGAEIEIFTHTTSFGRDRKLSDITLYDEDDKSSVSGLHCTLTYDPIYQKFTLTDDNSSVGTRVNGQLIQANDPVELTHGDEIILGDIFRQGAKLQFLSMEGGEDVGDITQLDPMLSNAHEPTDIYDPSAEIEAARRAAASNEAVGIETELDPLSSDPSITNTLIDLERDDLFADDDIFSNDSNNQSNADWLDNL